MFKKGRLESILLSFALLAAMPGLTASAFAQVRSTIQASARVVEAGPAWSAHRDLQSVVGELSESPGLTALDEGSVILTDGAEGSASTAYRVTVVRSGVDFGEAAVNHRAPNDAVTDHADDRRSHPLAVREPGDPGSPDHVIVYVEHIAN